LVENAGGNRMKKESLISNKGRYIAVLHMMIANMETEELLL
jgi:hypothetical protein